MPRSIALIHAAPAARLPIVELLTSQLPGVRLVEIMDTNLLEFAQQKGGLLPRAVRRFAHLALLAADSRVDLIQATCSAYREAIEVCRKMIKVPILAPDEGLVRNAPRLGSRLGVVATVAGAVSSILPHLEARFVEAGVEFRPNVVVCNEAFLASQRGDWGKHDRLLVEEADRLAANCNAVLFLQFSMSRAAELANQSCRVPVVSTVEACVAHIRCLLDSKG